MRLIDADKFAIEEPKLWDWGSVDGISSTAVLKQCIWDVQCAPIVHAIPIEWILKWACEFVNPNSEGYKMAMELVHDWEKENGK